MIEILIKISTIFATILIGYAGAKSKLVSGEAQNHLISLILNINIPCMLIYAISKNEIADDALVVTIEMLLISIAYFIVAAVAAILIVKLCRIKIPTDKGVYKTIFTSINTGFIGFPISSILFGAQGLYFMMLHNIILNVALYSICMVQLSGHKEKKNLITSTLKHLVNPCIISACIGLVLLFAGLHLPQYVNEVIKPIGDATIPIAMLIVGLQLADGKLSDCFLNKKLLLFSLITMIVWPLLLLFLVDLLPIYKMIKIAIILGAALPPATTISALAANEHANYKLAADGIVLTTLLSAISIPMTAILIYAYI